MKTTSRTVQRTLAFVNKLRATQGKKPLKKMPKGLPNNAAHCPIAAALSHPHVHASVQLSGPTLTDPCIAYTDKHHRRRYPKNPPQYVRQFILAFDRGAIPELIAK